MCYFITNLYQLAWFQHFCTFYMRFHSWLWRSEAKKKLSGFVIHLVRSILLKDCDPRALWECKRLAVVHILNAADTLIFSSSIDLKMARACLLLPRSWLCTVQFSLGWGSDSHTYLCTRQHCPGLAKLPSAWWSCSIWIILLSPTLRRKDIVVA